MTTRVKWVEDRLFMGKSSSGHSVMMEAKGGDEASIAPSPMEMLILGMGGCTTFDVVHILGRMREDVVDCEVDIDAERSTEDPKVYTKIHCHFKVSGRGLKDKKVQQAVEMSAEKYCSASLMLQGTVEISHSFEIIEE